MKLTCSAVGAVAIASLSLLTTAASAQTFTKTLAFSRFADFPNIKEVTLTYDMSLGTTTLTTPAWIAHTPGADGILFAPDGDLIIGGQGNAVYKVDYPNFTYTGVTAGGVNSFHVMLDPRGDKVWTAGNLGELASVPLNPFANGTPVPLSGDDQEITHIVFAGGQAWYTASLPTGNGNFGRIDLTTGVTTRLFTDVPWAHGACYDCYTGDVMVFANDRIAQFDPATQTVVSQLNLAPLGQWINMDQGTSDGVGHIYVASNTGYIVFVDMTISGLVGSPDFVDAPFCDTFLDDLAPDCGLGGRPNCPRSQGYWKTHGVRWPVATLTMGCQNYTKAESLALIAMPVGGDASRTLAKQLIAAKLNVANNAYEWPTIVAAIEQADALLCGYAGRLPLGVAASSAAGRQMTRLAQRLESFNLGAMSPQCYSNTGTVGAGR
jgi:hypothetical protein